MAEFDLSKVKKEYKEKDVEELEEHVLDQGKEKKKRGEYEKETLIKILGTKSSEEAKKIAADRLLEIRRGEEFGWTVMEEINTAKELGISKEDLALITQMKMAKLQESLLKAQIKANKPKSYPKKGRGSFRGQDRGRGRGSKKE